MKCTCGGKFSVMQSLETGSKFEFQKRYRLCNSCGRCVVSIEEIYQELEPRNIKETHKCLQPDPQLSIC